ncbi:helix-turn-helix transcriptional regulator [Streptomyces sp. NPDC046977]|uniref:helix-turn-helix transcriptional regulator n=1 Tax=Streptomyces sp. NPDC046977 TaxID=3154703 RepID=UPI0033DA5951
MPETNDLLEVEEIAYRLLVTAGTVSVDQVAAETGVSAEASEEALTSLVAKGLADRTCRPDARFSPAAQPVTEVQARLRQQAEALDRARATVETLLTTYHTVADRTASQPVERITGAAAIAHRVELLQEEARHEMVWLVRSQDFLTGGHRFGDHVRHRVLCGGTVVRGDAEGDVARHLARFEGLARVVPHVPVDLAISDRDAGLCLLAPEPPGDESLPPTAVVVRDSGILDALRLLFETQWEMSLPWQGQGASVGEGDASDAAPAALDEADLRILTLLIEGATEKAAARHLGVSLRTLQRRIGRLMTLTGASSRMQLAWQAARRGWLR